MYSARYSSEILLDIDFFFTVSKNTQMSNFMKIRPLGAEVLPCVQTEGRKHEETKSRFCNSEKVSKNFTFNHNSKYPIIICLQYIRVKYDRM